MSSHLTKTAAEEDEQKVFTIFQKLPIELRLMIWGTAIDAIPLEERTPVYALPSFTVRPADSQPSVPHPRQEGILEQVISETQNIEQSRHWKPLEIRQVNREVREVVEKLGSAGSIILYFPAAYVYSLDQDYRGPPKPFKLPGTYANTATYANIAFNKNQQLFPRTIPILEIETNLRTVALELMHWCGDRKLKFARGTHGVICIEPYTEWSDWYEAMLPKLRKLTRIIIVSNESYMAQSLLEREWKLEDWDYPVHEKGQTLSERHIVSVVLEVKKNIETLKGANAGWDSELVFMKSVLRNPREGEVKERLREVMREY